MAIDNRLGEPDPALVPKHVMGMYLPKEAADLYVTGYLLDNYGLLAARKAVLDDFLRSNGDAVAEPESLDPDNVVLTSGATYAAANLHWQIRKTAGSVAPEAALLEPGYNLYLPQLKEIGFAIRPVNVLDVLSDARADKREREARIFDRLAGAVTKETALLILTDPGNPTGTVFSRAFKERLLTELLDVFPGLHIHHDAIYAKIRRPHVETCSLFALADDKRRERVFETSSVSKAFLPAVRGGWAILHKKHLKSVDARLDCVHGQLGMEAQLSVIAALEATPRVIPNYYAEINRVYGVRAAYVKRRLEAIPGVNSIPPEGAFYVFADFSALKARGTTAGAVVEEAKRRGILLAHGARFGAPDGIRVNAAAPGRELKAVLDAIRAIIGEKEEEPDVGLAAGEDVPRFEYRGYETKLGFVRFDAAGNPHVAAQE
jgi:aspartate aminotransferase